MRIGFSVAVIAAAGATLSAAPASSRADSTIEAGARPRPAAPEPSVADLDSTAAGEDEQLYSCGKARGKVAVSFKPEVELADLVSWAMGFTCKNFVYSSALAKRAARVTIVAPEKMTPAEAWRVFLVALQAMGLNVVPKGKVLEIHETAQARDRPLPLYRDHAPSDTDQVVRMILRPRHLSADQLAEALSLLASTQGQVTALPRAGIVIITDHGSHIARMTTLAAEVDRPVTDQRLYALRILHVDAVELARKLEQLLGGEATPIPQVTRGKKGGAKARSAAVRAKSAAPTAAGADDAIPSRIVADAYTNTLFVVGTERAYQRVLAIRDRLDLELDGGRGQIHLYELENADATKLAQTLAPLTAATRAATPTRGHAPATGGAELEGQVLVAADQETNALLVVASARDFLALSKIIRRLDAPRRQVYIEAVILEVRADATSEIGVSYHGGKQRDDGSILLGGLQHAALRSASVKDTLGTTGLLAAAFGPVLSRSKSLIGTSIPSFGLAVEALATGGLIDVVSSPHILTANHVLAEISVGENIPYQGRLTTLPTSTGDPGSTLAAPSIERQKVARTLKITPHINNSDLVRLDIELDISDVDRSHLADGLGPSWTTRTIKNTVWVPDQDSVVIGGLVADRVDRSTSKVPLLGDLPLLGYLFRWRHQEKVKANLLVLLTPHILDDRAEMARILERRNREREELGATAAHLNAVPYRTGVDYRKKRGLVAEIDHAVRAIEKERAELEALHRRPQPPLDGPIDASP